MTTITHIMRAMDDDHTPYQRAQGEGQIKVSVLLNGNGIQLGVESYGEKTAAVGHGHPILLEKVDGQLRLVVWSDITDEEPTHIISLESAKEELLLNSRGK